MENDNNKMNPFFKLLIIFFIIFIAFYIALESGYYPSRIEKKTIITNKEITKFEEDIKKGKAINEKGYIKEDINYSNFVTKAGNGLTFTLGKIIEEGTKGISKAIKVLFW